MSPKLKPLLLPQLVERRRKNESVYSIEQDHPFYYTTNSSASDLTSPVTPTFSTKGHVRYSSSTSSLELPPQVYDSPSSPLPPTSTTKNGMRQLPDVQEEPFERDDEDTIVVDDHALYSCLCDEPCQHRRGSEGMISDAYAEYYDTDFYDIGFLSEDNTDFHYPSRKRAQPNLMSRVGSHFAGMKTWKSGRKSNMMSSPTTEVNFENVLSRASSASRESSLSASRRFYDRSNEPPVPATPAMSYYASTESVALSAAISFERERDEQERASLERDRALATTPLLPPLMTSALRRPEPETESPLQSPSVAPSVAPSPVMTEVPSPIYPSGPYSRPALSAKPSVSSFRHVSGSTELPLAFPAHLQEPDEWSDRLGHCNFTITPAPYEPEVVDVDTVNQFYRDWQSARVNYTKHLVRVGENYGQTSKIYILTEAKWAEIEKRWKTIYEDTVSINHTLRGRSQPQSASASRSRSRGRGRGRAGSANASVVGRPINDDIFAAHHWRRLEDSQPSAVPQMLEALDADGKFPDRGDVDIIGPMQRDEVMIRADSEERKTSRFWRSLVDKVGGLRR